MLQSISSYRRLLPYLPFLYLFSTSLLSGKFTASEITCEHPTLRRLVPYVEIGVDDHFLAAYRRSLRAVLPTRHTRYNPTNTTEKDEREEEEEEEEGEEKHMEVQKEVEEEVERRPVPWQVLPSLVHAPHLIISQYILSYHIISHHITPYHITSHHITSHHDIILLFGLVLN